MTDESYRENLDEVALLVCGDCLLEGCWPLIVEVQVTETDITWKNFHNPYRSADSAGGFWDYSKFGPFCFDKTEYLKEIEKLKQFSE